MAIDVKILKKWGEFCLDIRFQSQSKRIGILGASGCGKSMTLKSIAGIETPDSGYIEIDGNILFDKETKINLKTQKRKVGYLFQNYALFPTMTVEQNIAAGLKGKKPVLRRRVGEMVRKFGLTGLENRYPHQLSGGQQQRTALARIMAYEPEVILLDEPFSALDMYLKDRMEQELLQMLELYEGTVIMVSHNRDEIYRFSEEVLVMDEGKIAAFGKTEDLFQNPKSRTAARLTGCKNFSKMTRIDDHTLDAEEWGVRLKVKQTVPQESKWIGYRAHDFIPVWGERGENMLPFRLKSSARLPFEQNYYIAAEDESPICWFVQREKIKEIEEKGYPDYLWINEEKILFLN
jgi:molybdate transport system ATP-binding protein